jgi:LysR family transcriptional regulator, hca operon transcriptional activator
VLMPAAHPLATKDTIHASDLVGETLIGVPYSNSPALRAVTDEYGRQMGIDLTPDHEAMISRWEFR